jgi:hypothetical protein
VRIKPFAVLEQHAREEYRKRFASVPEPRVLNAHALVSFAAPRSLVWGGVGYWVPPLSYEDGNRLLAAASFIHDALRQDKPVAATAASKTAARILHALLPRRRPPVWRVGERLRQWFRSRFTFYHDPPEQIESLLRWLLHVEDDAPLVPADRQATIDLIDNKYAFEGHFKRPPLSWKDYVYGMRHIARQASREDLRGAVAARIGVNADAKGWRDYERELRALAGW